MGYWLLLVIISILFTPSFRLMGTVPVRIDDIIIFAGAGFFLSKRVVMLKLPKLEWVAVSALAVVGSILVSTLLVSLASPGLITVKEYLDLVRPLKWLFLYWIVADMCVSNTLELVLRTLYRAWWILLGLCILEIVLGRYFPNMPLAQFLASFRNGGDWDAVSSHMDKRPFATLESPTTLGYLATIGIFLGYLFKDASKRRVFIVISCALLVVTMVRTFFFALPILFVMHALLRSKNWKSAIREVSVSMGILLVLAFFALVVMPIVSPSVADLTFGVFSTVSSGNATDDYSIGNRIANLSLAATTWSQAPWIGVATRAFLPEYVDSELIITFHRYGMVGLFALLSVYPAGILMALRIRKENLELAASIVMMLVITFLYGITQGALINSRAGGFAYILLGILAAADNQRKLENNRQTILRRTNPRAIELQGKAER
jgi:hypothetical protein